MKKVLILGASSDIGYSLTKKYLNKNFCLRSLQSKCRKVKENKKKNLKIFNFDLKKITNFEKFVQKKSEIFKNIDIFVSLTGYLKLKKIEKSKVKDFIRPYKCKLFIKFYSYKKSLIL